MRAACAEDAGNLSQQRGSDRVERRKVNRRDAEELVALPVEQAAPEPEVEGFVAPDDAGLRGRDQADKRGDGDERGKQRGPTTGVR